MSAEWPEPAGEQLTAGLRRLAEDTVVPPIDPAQEQRLLAAFDEYWSPRQKGLVRTRARPRRVAAALGLLAAAASLVWMVVPHGHRPEAPRPAPPTIANSQTGVRPASDRSDTPQTATVPRPQAASGRPPQPRRATVDDAAFVMWPGATDLPRFESGQLMRVELPASVVVSLGLRPSRPPRGDGQGALIQTDVLVGQDGYARAVRLVQ